MLVIKSYRTNNIYERSTPNKVSLIHRRLIMTGDQKGEMKQSHIRAPEKCKHQQNKGYPEIHTIVCREPFYSADFQLRYRIR